ncbi:hypothetical protein Bca101_066228 [Brassica carinata]
MIMIPIQSYFILFLSLIFNTLASPTLQRDALLEFKNEFPISAPDPSKAAFYTSLSTWNTRSGHCSWEGVTCSANSGEVISLSLQFIFLNGSLKANTSLLKLQHLQHLIFASCNLRGEIPSSLGKLSHLIELDLSSNNLVGEIPSSLGNLSHLTNLDLGYNHLIGEVPPSIGNLNHLTFMSLYSNNLSGNIPSSFANFNKLSQLSLSENQFSGGDLPLILSNLTSLSNLDISNNHIKSKLPSNMSGFHNLEQFAARRNSFVGNVPSSLFTLPFLRNIYLSENHFEGPLEFGNNRSSSYLYWLDLSYNNFYGPIPEFIPQFLSLISIDLSHNSFSGPIPGSMSKLASLDTLDLSYNNLEGQVPGFLWRLSFLTLSHNSFSSLEEPLQVVVNGSQSDLSSSSFRGQVHHVDLSSNSLRGSFLQQICECESLYFFDASNNHLSGSIPSCLMNFTVSFRDISLRNNNLSGFLPDTFTNANELRSLDVSRNQLAGKLPKSLINCKSMEYLNLKGNKFNDTFPSWLGSLGELRVLFLGSNAFYGPISSHVGFPSLRVIDISRNGFSGTLPQDYFVNWHEMSSAGRNETEWFEHTIYEDSLNSLDRTFIYNYKDSMDMMYKGVDTEFPHIFLAFKAIDFSGNKFTGRIPNSIGLLKKLILVNFSRNAFTGSIPSSLANLTNLEALDLSHNKLSGNIPRDLANLSFLSYVDFSHNLLQGPVPRSTQFQSQNCSSFEDNLGLYGLEEICEEIHVPDPTSGDSQQSEEYSSEEVLDWIAAAIAYGPGVFCGLVIGHIFFTSHKHIWFMENFGLNNPRGTITVSLHILSRPFLDPKVRLLLQLDVKVAKKAILDGISPHSIRLFQISNMFIVVYTTLLPGFRKTDEDALLEFKNEFPTSASDPDDPFAFSFSSWNKSSDHCSWKGVRCSANSGEVISLFLDSIFLNGSLKANTSLLKLHHLYHLTLTRCNLRGEIPSSLGNLSHLIQLDLSYNELGGEVPSSIGNLSFLSHLDLSSNYLIGEIPSSIGNISPLIELYLYGNHLIGEIPSSLENLSHLTTLILAENHLIGEIPPSMGNLNKLTFMNLGPNNLSGNIPSSFANFNKLTQLILSYNQFSGGDLPYILSNLTSLSSLDLSNNHFKSKLPSDMSGLNNLEIFSASGNYFGGNVSTSLFLIPSLKEVYLSENQLEGPLEFGNTFSSSELQYLDLSSNNFHGPIPEDISRFRKLQTLDLSNNRFIGAIPESMSKLVSLYSLDLSHNRFIGAIPGSMSKLVSLYSLDLSNNSFIGEIPESMSKLVSLSSIDLSYNKLEGQVPSLLWSLSSLKLSHNSFSSLEEVVVNGSHSDLSSTSFQGPVHHVDLGSNSFRGSFPPWICNCTSLVFLDLSNNHLSGSIPSCLMDSSATVRQIILRNNKLSGFLPDIFTSATKLRSLDVSINQLMGKLPKSLINCKSMEYLNLKGNNFKDTFPSWLGSLVSLRVLILGTNAFYGPISSHLGFPSLRVIDISHNSFNGTLPQDHFVNWFEMSTVWVDITKWYEHIMDKGRPSSVYMGELYNYTDSMDMMYKGVDTEFPLIFLAYKAIDFSGNEFTGRIPKSLGLLKALIHVNFSRNAFTGSIPSSLANITNLEALDLSHNKLSGNIPPDLAKLSFVSYLDFSHNLLQGPVPRSTQFQSQNCSSFEDNLGLYGLEEICGPIHVPHPTSGDSQQSQEFSSEESEEVLNWIAAAIAFGPGVLCGLVIGHIFFTSQKNKWLMEKFGRNHPGGIITAR